MKYPSLQTLVRTDLPGGVFRVSSVLIERCLLSFCPPDIRDTVNYKEVMKQYGLGPNGGIVTSLNLFATRFDQVTQEDK